jgi:diguanylate cyclase (GGDEF)-like protein/PAS domain S-box-containing protein
MRNHAKMTCIALHCSRAMSPRASSLAAGNANQIPTKPGHMTMLDALPSRSSRDSDSVPPMQTAIVCALAHIARGAPLAETAMCVLDAVCDQAAGVGGAIFQTIDDGAQLQTCAAAGMEPGLVDAIEGLVADCITAIPGTEISASRFERELRAAIAQSGFHGCVMLPLYAAGERLLGIALAVALTPERLTDACRQSLADAAPLMAIAIERAAADARIKAAESGKLLMALAIEGSGTGIWDRNVQTGEINYSDGWKAMLGYAASEIGNRIEDSYTRLHPDDLAYVQAAMQAHFDGTTGSYEVEHRIRCKDGSYKWICSRGKIVARDGEGRPLRMIGTTTDITTLRALSERLQQNVDLITNLTNQVPGLVYQYRQPLEGGAFFPYASEGIREIYELGPRDVARSVEPVLRLVHPDDRARYVDSLQASAASLSAWHLEYRVVLPRQGICWRQANARPHRLPDGGTLWHGFITDITERKRIELELHAFATTDFLTQLPNRRCFMERLEQERMRIRRVPHARAAVLMCDLDHFKCINDSHGHATGDLVLKHFAGILRTCLRSTDIAGRVGGEEFAMILPGLDCDEARRLAERLQQAMTATPFKNGDRTISVTMSIGITAMNAADAAADVALSRSDRALYLAKENGRDRIETVTG